MPAPRESPLRFMPRGVTDSLDGDNSAPGSMTALTNLIRDPSTPGVFVCRPANLKISTFSGSGIATPGIVSTGMQLNGIIYGLIGTSSPAGKDIPFAYVISSNTFLTVNGITSANCPTTQASSGDWTPPTMDALGTKLIVTHPGFNYSAGYAFGYFDISSFTLSTAGTLTSGSAIVTGNPTVTGLAPGYTISGTNVPSGTTVLNYSNFNLTTTGNTNSTTTVSGIANLTGGFRSATE